MGNDKRSCENDQSNLYANTDGIKPDFKRRKNSMNYYNIYVERLEEIITIIKI